MLQKPSLYLIPNTLGNNDISLTIPQHIQTIINSIEDFAVENVKSAVRFLKLEGIQVPSEQLKFYQLSSSASEKELISVLVPIRSGKSVGIISESGLPCIADPGAKLVALAHKKGIRVIPLSGPSSVTMALMASGFNGQSFCFHGYLPLEKKNRFGKIKQLEKSAKNENQTQIFIEAPHRNDRLLEELLDICRADTLLSLSVNLTQPDEIILTNQISWWKKNKITIGKRPAIFLLGSD